MLYICCLIYSCLLYICCLYVEFNSCILLSIELITPQTKISAKSKRTRNVLQDVSYMWDIKIVSKDCKEMPHYFEKPCIKMIRKQLNIICVCKTWKYIEYTRFQFSQFLLQRHATANNIGIIIPVIIILFGHILELSSL